MNRPQLQKAVIAGVAGTIVMTIMTMVAPMMGMPEMDIPQMLAGFMGFPIIIGWFAHFMIGTTFALLYAYVFVQKLPGAPWIKGMLFGLLPWFLSQVTANPVMGAGIFAMNTPAPMMVVVGSFLGHLAYGVVVGVVYGSVGVKTVRVAQSH
jgi:hypothetical protein